MIGGSSYETYSSCTRKGGNIVHDRSERDINGTRVVEASGKFIMGEGSYINGGGHIRAVGADITLGRFVSVSDNVCMNTSYGSHYRDGWNLKCIKPIVIKDGAWIGYGAMIRGGVTIGRYAVVGMGAVVVQDVPDYHIVVGNPARDIGERPDADYLRKNGDPYHKV